MNPAPARVKSAIYQGRVRHRRFLPKAREFTHSVCYFYLDLSEIPRLFSFPLLFSDHAPSLFGFRRPAYVGPQTLSLDTAVRAKVVSRLGFRPTGPIRVLTQISYLGLSFNPVSFYYCFETEEGTNRESLVAIVSEITNTPWSERHAYAVDCRDGKRGFEFKKEFHVSPFLGMDYQYRWRFSHPENLLSIQMENRRENSAGVVDLPVTFDATLTLSRQEWTNRNLFRALLRQPLMTWKTYLFIYAHAGILWLRRFPFFAHPGRTT